MRAPARFRFRHLQAAAIALLVSAGLIFLSSFVSQRFERRHLRALLAETASVKNQGVRLQRAAFASNEVLPLYGSSELVKDIPVKASEFFRRAPSDFMVCPVGKAGSASLVMAERLAAVGPAVRGRKVALLLSPSWFFLERGQRQYAGSFSPLQASTCLFSDDLSFELRTEMARRMMQFPETLEDHPLLQFAAARLVSGTNADRLLFRMIEPLGWLDAWVGDLQDEIQVGCHVLANWSELRNPPRREASIDWGRLEHRWENRALPFRPRSPDRQSAAESAYRRGDQKFITAIDQSEEWQDLELCLRVLHELGARPLVLSMPINGAFYDALGVTPRARAHYYARLQTLAAEYATPEVDFEGFEEDPTFFADTYDHPSGKGWIYFDEVLDAFFHNRILPRKEKSARLGSTSGLLSS